MSNNNNLSTNSNNTHYITPSPQTGYELAAKTGFWWVVDNVTSTVTNLNALGVKIHAYTGAGMPPIENISTPFGLRGGDLYQRTVIKPRIVTLVCIVEGVNLGRIQKIKQSIINLVAPNVDYSTARDLTLRYQLVNNCGTAIGKPLECPVKFVGGVEGNTDNLYQDRFSLVFVEQNPPSITELSTLTSSLNYNTSDDTDPGYLFYRVFDTDTWVLATQADNPVHSIARTLDSQIIIGTSEGVIGPGAITVTTGGPVYSIIAPDELVLIAAGNFTTGSGAPGNYIIQYDFDTETWYEPVAGINGVVYALANGDQAIYAGGSFTSPATRLFSFNDFDGTIVNSYTANNTVRALSASFIGSNFAMLVGGDFTSINSVAANRIAYILEDFGTTHAISSGANGTVRSIVYVASELYSVVVAGDFTTIGGVAANRVAYVNATGTAFAALGVGLNGSVTSISSYLNPNSIYAVGSFTAPGDDSILFTEPVAYWDGTYWNEVNVDFTGTPTINVVFVEPLFYNVYLGLNSSVSSITTTPGQTTVTYTGTAPIRPNFTFTGPGQLRYIKNVTTDKTILFTNLDIASGETVTLTLSSVQPSLISSVSGNILGKINPTSNLDFNLRVGTNVIEVLIDGSTGLLTGSNLSYKNTHYSFDAGSYD